MSIRIEDIVSELFSIAIHKDDDDIVCLSVWFSAAAAANW